MTGESFKRWIWAWVFLSPFAMQGQNNFGTLSGNLELNGNFFIRDSVIEASNTPQYDHQLYGAEGWMQLNYSGFGFDIGLRYDVFNNSSLLNRQDSYTDQGLGRWYIKKKINDLGISGGYLYDQIGSGIIFRAFEDRALLIDNALKGFRLTYDLGDNWSVKAFTGRQKRQFSDYDSVVKGASIEGFITGNDSTKTSNWSLAPGVGIVNRTFDDATMEGVVGELSNYLPEDEITPKYNNYAVSFFNTLSVGSFSWYLEAAYKTPDVFIDPFAERVLLTGATTTGKIVDRAGNIIYTSLGYAASGFGGTLEYKRTEDFTLRTDPFALANQGMINFLPPMARVNTYRLTARYAPATQELGEQAVQVDLRYSPSRKWNFNVNISNITNLDSDLLYREIYSEISYKYKRKWTLSGGLQLQSYNQDIFENKPGVPIVETITPFAEFLYKIDRKKSIRTEFQFLSTDQDFGDWVFGLVEFSIAPNWTFTVSDMYNLEDLRFEPHHFPRVDVFYNYKANRFSLSYIKQVEGIVCTGGICRLEPAFSGVRLTVNSTF
ncbi:MAG: hypothetical protein HKN16_01930 [Saprospiraceae bacterium]|nr:hypothetical protein [Saprospiraceae bacterium]